MEVDQLIDQAIARAGSSDFGADGWQEPLAVLVASLNEDADLNELGEGAVFGSLVDRLTTRLQVERFFGEHPEIEQEVIERPVFGLGLPRTGSTALSFLLALDDEHRSLRTWESGAPVPPPEAATQHDDPRIAAAAEEIDFINAIYPDFVDMIPSSATGPTECLILMALDFRSQMFEAMARIPAYSAYLADCDFSTTYAYHRRVLQLLQWHCPPKRWWLKTPAHMQHIDELDNVYPDAQFIMTHRDITKVLPSVCALMSALSGPTTSSPDPSYFGRLTSDEWEQSLHRLITFRDGGQADRFHDVQFLDLQRDPVGTVRELYAGLDLTLRDESAAAMADWWQANSSDRAGGRRYDAAEFGLDLDEVRKRFAFYTDRFGADA